MARGRGRQWLSWGLSVLLLGWIAGAIFAQEARSELASPDLWGALSPIERWRLVWTTGPQGLWGSLTSVGWGRFWASWACVGATIGLGALRWYWLLRALKVPLSFWHAFRLTMAGYFFNSFLFGSTGGDVVRAAMTARLDADRRLQAVVSVISDRAAGLVSMAVFASVMALGQWARVSANPALLGVASFVWVAALGGALALALSAWAPGERVARRWFSKVPAGGALIQAVTHFRELTTRPRLFGRVFLVSILINLFCVWQLMILQGGLEGNAPLRFMAFAVPAIICVSAIPITPSGLGVRENLYVYVLTAVPFGFQGEEALTLSLLAYAGVLLWSAIGSLFYLSIASDSKGVGAQPEGKLV